MSEIWHAMYEHRSYGEMKVAATADGVMINVGSSGVYLTYAQMDEMTAAYAKWRREHEEREAGGDG